MTTYPQAALPSSPAAAGEVVAWGDASNEHAEAAMEIPGDLTAPVAALATTTRSMAAVTADGALRVWGAGDALEVLDVPPGITDAVAVALAQGAGLVLHRDGAVTGWGSEHVAAVPEGLQAKAIALGQGGTIAYAVRTDGTLEVWGDPTFLGLLPAPELTDLVDVAADQYQVLALHADGTVASWGLMPQYGQANVPDFGEAKVEQVVAGSAASGVVLDDGTIEVWGQTPPAGEPEFGGETEGADETVVNLSLGTNGGAVTADGAVHTWGANAAINDHDPSLAGEPVAAIVVGDKHAAAIVTTFRALTEPVIAGTPQVGQSLTATPGTFSLAPDAPATGQWYADAAPIAGQTGTALALSESMVGKKITYRSTATRGGEAVTSTSNELGPVTALPSKPDDDDGDDEQASKAKSKIKKVKVKTKGNKRVAKKVRIVVAVRAAQGASPKGKVVVALKGKTKKRAVAKVNAKGKAKVVIKKVKRGKYKVKLRYRGNADVAPTKKSVRVRV